MAEFTPLCQQSNNHLPFLVIEIIKEHCQLRTRVHWKITNTGLLFHYQSLVDSRYKHTLLNTMLHCAFCSSSTGVFFNDDCNHIKEIFQALNYLLDMINSSVGAYISKMKQQESQSPPTNIVSSNVKTVRFIFPCKDQKSANMIRKQMNMAHWVKGWTSSLHRLYSWVGRF